MFKTVVILKKKNTVVICRNVVRNALRYLLPDTLTPTTTFPFHNTNKMKERVLW